jgi:hypothetical protein
MKALVEELRSERFDRAGTIVRLVGVVALIGLESVAARARAGNRADGLVNRAGAFVRSRRCPARCASHFNSDVDMRGVTRRAGKCAPMKQR